MHAQKYKDYRSFSLGLLFGFVLLLVLSLVVVSPQRVAADHGRTAGECSRLDDAQDRQLCQEHARSNPSGVPQDDSVPYGVEAECKPDKDKGEELNTENCGILYYAQKIIDVMTALVGVVVVIMIIVGGIQYSASRNDPGAVAAAKQKIVNAVIALLVYIFMWAFLQWIIPGGVL